MTFRIILAVWLVITAGLAVTSAVTLTMVAHDRPLHHAYACQFARDFRQEVHLPPASCQYPAPAVCHFDGGGLSLAGSVTRTRDGRPWLCTDDGQLTPWHVQVPDVRKMP
jgi:hypothetical protein